MLFQNAWVDPFGTTAIWSRSAAWAVRLDNAKAIRERLAGRRRRRERCMWGKEV
jgi:hypothetical protein